MDTRPAPSSWCIYGRREITEKYEIMECLGSGAYSDVYRGRRISDSLPVALKEVHDYQSAYREIDALQVLRGSPNIIVMHEYFWRDGEDAVLVLEYLQTDLASVVREAKKTWEEKLFTGEIKTWMIQILEGLDACHRNLIVHRDIKPSNLLISGDGVLKLADFGQAVVLTGSAENDDGHGQTPDENVEKFTSAPGSNSDTVDKMSEVEGDDQRSDGLHTSCAGTRWFRAPELLYGCRYYGTEIDLWSLGCTFSELLSLEPLFPGNSDIDQIGKIIDVLGNLTEEVFPGVADLPDYKAISFGKVENPIGLEARLSNRNANEIRIVKRLLCLDPSRRASAGQILLDPYFMEEPFPIPATELRIPSSNSAAEDDDDSPRRWDSYVEREEATSDFDEFDIATAHSIRFA